MHHIQHYILTVLARTKWARFRDMRPPKVDSNAYSYHLTLLRRQGLIEKHSEKGYRLSPRGLALVDRMSTDELQLRIQPKIITMCFLYSPDGRLLLFAKSKQPFIGAWTPVTGKLHLADSGALEGARREIQERIAVQSNESLKHRAIVTINASIASQAVSSVLAHICTMTIHPNEVARTDALWANDDDLSTLQLAPGVQQIHDLLRQDNGQFHYDEFSIDW